MSIQSLGTSQLDVPYNRLAPNNDHSERANDAESKARVNQESQNSLTFSVPEARKLLNDKIIAALDKTLAQSNQTSIYELAPADFSPEKVANRILSLVSAAFSNISQETAQTDKLAQARAAIEKGFNEAKDILEGLGVFKDDIKGNANKTYGLLQKGLDQITENIKSGLPITEGLFSGKTERSTLSRQSFTFELTTTDGDKISISMERQEATSENREGFARLTQAGYSVSIEGNLDADEREAIDQLLTEMGKVAEVYFSGDTQAALKQVSQLGYDSAQIASFSLSLRDVQQTKETSVYQQVDGLSSDRPSVNSLGQIMTPLRAYAAQFLELMTNERMVNNESQYLRLFEQVARINDRFDGESRLAQFNGLNEELLTRS